MKKKLNITILGLLLSILMLLSGTYAVKDIAVNPASITETLNTGESYSRNLSVTNTGNETINISLQEITLSSGSSTISTDINPLSRNNVAPGDVVVFTLTLNTGSNEGTFEGDIPFFINNNATEHLNVSISITVEQQVNEGASIDLLDATGNRIIFSGDADDQVRKRVRFENDGSVDLTNIEFSISDLDGDRTTDEIDEGDFEIEGTDVDRFEIEELNVGDISSIIDIEVDIPRNIDVTSYTGTLTLTSSEGLDVEFDIEVVVGGDFEIEIDENDLDVDAGTLEIFAEEGKTESDNDFIVRNTGDVDAPNLVIELDDDLRSNSNTIPRAEVTFDPQVFDLDEGDIESVEVRVSIPEGTPSGDYFSDIVIYDQDDNELDSITLKVKVIGDVYLRAINFDEDVEPGQILDVPVTVVNQGSRIVRNVKIRGVIENIEFGGGDITESSTTFLLDVNDEQTETLRFNIPEDARDGSHTLEITVEYDGEELEELKEVNVERPATKIVIESYAVNPRVLKCDTELFTYIKYRNLGRFDRSIEVSAEILGTNIEASTNTYELNVDTIDQQNLVLDVSTLEPGTYTVSQRVSFGASSVKEDTTIRVEECRDTSTGIDIEPRNETGTNETANNNTINLFGNEYEKTTVYLGSGVVLVILLIIISLFLL